MILHKFPDLSWLKSQIQQHFQPKQSWGSQKLENKGWPTVLLNVKTNFTERNDILGPFSLFFNISGTSIVQVGSKRIHIGDSSFVISNFGDSYSLLINQPDQTETLNIHFGEKFYKEALTANLQTHETLLDNPFEVKSKGLHVPFRSFFTDHHFLKLATQLFYQLKTAKAEDLSTQEKLFALFSHLMQLGEHERNRIESLTYLKSSTRQEIVERLALVVDFMHYSYQKVITLDVLTEVSCISKFHLIRVFKEAYLISPYQYLKKIRLEKAQILLQTTDKSIHEIAMEVGLENGSSLSRLFYQTFRRYPTHIRAHRISNFGHQPVEENPLPLYKKR